MSALGRAAGKFEKAFVALPASTKQAVALAVYRAAPAIQQYQKDLTPLAEDPEIVDALWALTIAAAFKLATKGKEGIGEKQLAEMRDAAPETFDFIVRVGQMASGMLPGVGAAVPALPALQASEGE